MDQARIHGSKLQSALRGRRCPAMLTQRESSSIQVSNPMSGAKQISGPIGLRTSVECDRSPLGRYMCMRDDGVLLSAPRGCY